MSAIQFLISSSDYQWKFWTYYSDNTELYWDEGESVNCVQSTMSQMSLAVHIYGKVSQQKLQMIKVFQMSGF